MFEIFGWKLVHKNELKDHEDRLAACARRVSGFLGGLSRVLSLVGVDAETLIQQVRNESDSRRRAGEEGHQRAETDRQSATQTRQEEMARIETAYRGALEAAARIDSAANAEEAIADELKAFLDSLTSR